MSEEERKRQRLEAWKRKQQQKHEIPPAPLPAPPVQAPVPPFKMKLTSKKKPKTAKLLLSSRPESAEHSKTDKDDGLGFTFPNSEESTSTGKRKALDEFLEELRHESKSSKKQRINPKQQSSNKQKDTLDLFMDQLQYGIQEENNSYKGPSLDTSGSMVLDRRDSFASLEESKVVASSASAAEVERYFEEDVGVVEEYERASRKQEPDALQVLADLNKKKELGSVDHSKIDYLPFQKNLYRVPRKLAELKSDQVLNLRAKLNVKVRGSGAPAPVSSFDQCGLSQRIIDILNAQNIREPFPVQAQCIPTIMAGRDCIGIAQTGSGKTLAYVLPMLRHILVQPELEPHETGPIALILAPARELAFQIHVVCRRFAKDLGLK